MQIAFVVYGTLDQISGGFIYDRALVGGLRALGHDVHVYSLPWHGYFGAVARSAVLGWTQHRNPERVPETSRDGLRSASRAPSARYDVVVQDELIHPSVFRSNRSRAAWPRGRSVVALVHNLRSRQPATPLAGLAARVERRYFDTVDGALCVCDATLADVRALAGRDLPATVVRAGRDHVAPDVDDAAIDERSRAPGPLRVLHAAAVSPEKGLDRLLAALARAPGLAFTLDVVGRLGWPAHARRIRRQVARLGFGDRVRIHGERTGAELRALFRRSHVLALPSDREAYSLAALEALGFGLPVLAPAAGGTGEMIQDGREGYLLDPHDTAAWARALRALGEDRGALRTMAVAALGRYRAHATWREAAAAAAAFIAKLRPPLETPAVQSL
jgi:glycosyltransferase involved in cell wall biosynthesis